MHFQKKVQRIIKPIFCIALVTVLCFELYAHIFLGERVALIALFGYLALLCTMFLLAGVNKRLTLQNKHLDYRGLAEGLRTQLFWSIAGIHRATSDYYLRKQRSDVAWIRDALSGCFTAMDLCRRRRGVPSPLGVDGFAIVRENWIAGQLRYFNGKLITNDQHINRLERLTFYLFCAATVASTLLLTYLSLSGHVDWHGQHIAIVVIGMLLAAAGLSKGYLAIMAYGEESQQYQRMSAVFAIAKTALNDTSHSRSQSDILIELGCQALEEHEEWIQLHRTHPVEVPVG